MKATKNVIPFPALNTVYLYSQPEGIPDPPISAAQCPVEMDEADGEDGCSGKNAQEGGHTGSICEKQVTPLGLNLRIYWRP